ncbi:penicillin acylase family protein [Desulfospira joergensenii]|uniref:penicillin acylase family protein n=1 Tax=Desulfospira joergensenii TaxID=53329 RepID=UPI0003B35131|nr:penicillin acylase family protein [Desulfospira joergensenii]
MKWFRIFVALLGLVALVGAGLILSLPHLNDFQTKGEIRIPGLGNRVSLLRDEKGMAYARAQSLDDLFMAQGFATAQDRLFQMQLTRMMVRGRISELAGSLARDLDIRMRTLGLYAMAEKQATLLDKQTARFFQSYVNGINAFITQCPGDIPVEFRLSGIRPEPWKIADSISILYYMGFSTSANLDTEIIAQMLLETLGYEKTLEIMPLNFNPDDPGDTGELKLPARPSLGFTGGVIQYLSAYTRDRELRAGSNNWAVAPERSASGSPILAGDPHLDTRILPGVWYPMGLFSPSVRAVGVTIPGIPGMAVGRTSHMALAVTNNYGDMTDLYIETPDPENPGNYLEGDLSLPFAQVRETLKIRDKNAAGGFRTETILIRKTRRGPVVSDIFKDLKTNKIITLRFAPAESMGSKIGIIDILRARNSRDLSRALENCPMLCLNWVFADVKGNIGHRASGKIPVRTDGDGTFPHPVRDSSDNWQGWIPPNRMPGTINPAKKWIGTCNQKMVPGDYPWYYSSYFASSYRYRRLKQLMTGPDPLTVDDMWAFQRDTQNLMAEKVAPVMARALMKSESTRDLGLILYAWDGSDKEKESAPSVFQAIYRYFVLALFEDDLGEDKALSLIKRPYFWQERVEKMVVEGQSPWFDDIRTKDRKESLEDLMISAALRARTDLVSLMGSDPEVWEWGRIHTLELVNPIRRKGLGRTLLGTGPMPMAGSGETLYRAAFPADKPFSVSYCAALRMVADLGDGEKVAAVLPGGISGRTFHAHQRDQVGPFMKGEKLYWWFSDRAVDAHARAKLVLAP